MLRIALLLDDRLIEHVFQPVADTLYQQLRLTRFRAACWGLNAAAIAWVLAQSSPLSNAVMAWQAGQAVMRALLLLLGLTALLGLRSLFQLVAKSRTPNPLRAKMLPHRCLVLLFLTTDLAHLRYTGKLDSAADIAMLGFAATALYLAACASPPLTKHWSRLANAAAH
jgi:hypothetical protein